MTDDKALVDAYASIYEHHQKDADGNVIPHEEDKKEQIDEALPALAAPLLKFAGKKLLQFGVNKLKQKAVEKVGSMMRGGGPSTQAHRQNQMGMQAAHYEPEMDMVEDAEQLDELSKKTLNQYTYDAAERRGREKGIKMLDDLIGMFAFCLWDKVKNQGVLVRDRQGIKPCYITNLKTGGFAFASEIKSLLTLDGLNIEIDDIGLNLLHSFNYCLPPRTCYKEKV